ncbi:spondin domain-containing protein [Enterovibrio makurazakiensis]|uniref:Spondin domain-containing protein n=1 Tax=Enterovibrio gelatinilyticus TaxID=2899819 RepID=A0ABT5QY02_9GAMM|nr:spondin domain-containing protein [Enterovibrio sp. ZSDZ42]MDD1792795.1 spondin domain-containing protein [Enterovibrio sp. ZSDZ42]
MKPLLLAIAMGAAFNANAANIDVSITNATDGIYFTPLIVAAHHDDANLFQTGTPASDAVEAMAEGGDISGLEDLALSAGAAVSSNPAEGILAPGETASTHLYTQHGDVLSIAAMLLPSNDAFVGVDSWKIPRKKGTYVINANGYDAGTEANDELAANVPTPPFITFGSNGTGVDSEVANGNVHIHPGNLGDTNATGGISDFDSTKHRWLNPVAIITVTVY